MPRKPVRPLPAEPPAPEPTTSRTMADVLTLPDPLRQLATWMLRQDAVSLEEVVAHLGQETEQARALLDTLVAQDLMQVQDRQGVPQYRMCLLSRQRRQPARELWQTLGEKLKS
jgi:predicted ArsR family transcriptional regulator